MATFRGDMRYIAFIQHFERIANDYTATRIAYDSRLGIDGQVFEQFGNFTYEEDADLNLVDYDGIITGFTYTNYRAGLPGDFAQIRQTSLTVDQQDAFGSRDEFLRTVFAGNDLIQGGSDDPNYTGDEREILNGYDGNDRIFGYAADDMMDGGAGNDRLDGGTGADVMIGGTGNDVFFVDTTKDRVVERAGEGYDQVVASVTYSLRGRQVEGISLVAGTSNIGAVGNELNNKMVGNDGGNKLVGDAGNDALYGGLGKDALYGGSGNDKFVFDTALGPSNVDTIYDFANAVGDNDTIRLASEIFAVLPVGRLAAEAFRANADGVATETDDRIIYSTDTGKLFYDADGSDDGGAIQFAVLLTKPTIGAADFLVV